ncbi:MAG: sigma-70 family RNA polymerase sigma factor [Actinomycetota bacterium]
MRSSWSSTTHSFEAVFAIEYPRMVALAAAAGGSRAQAEDIAQEAMTKLHRDWDRIGTYDRPDLWLRRVTVNQARSWRRRLGAEGRALLRLGPAEATLPPTSEEDAPLWQAVNALPTMQRTVLALRHLEGHPLTDIAEMLDISASTARVHLHRAKQQLQRRFDTEYLTMGDAR